MASNDLRLTSDLFAAGMIAGPLFIVLSLFQALAREGFDIVRHPASLLSLGDWGWIQIVDFVLCGRFGGVKPGPTDYVQVPTAVAVFADPAGNPPRE